MAKLENSQTVESKGKKRKHNNTGTEDEVANKSVIVEAHAQSSEPMEINTETEQVNRKTKKRKNKEKGDIQEKRSKRLSNDDNFEQSNDDHEADDDHQEPTHEELKESEKPENNLAIVTGRQKKKQKHQKLLEVQKEQSAEKYKERNAEYLKKWKHMRESWKFEKLRQISIQQTMLDSDKLDADVWPIALEYLAGSKGAARDKIVKLANEVIDEIDKLCEQQETDRETQSSVNSVRYQRARDLLQTLD